MKEIAEANLGTSVSDCVLSVPVDFSSKQREALVKAGTSVGLTVRRILNDPATAALAHGFQYQNSNNAKPIHLLIYNLGGGSFSASLMTVNDGIFEMKATVSDSSFGGKNFDDVIVDHFLSEFCSRYRKDKAAIRGNSSAMFKLRDACENAKVILSTSAQTSIELDGFYEGYDFNSTITRAKFENLAFELFKKCTQPLEQLFQAAKMDRLQVDEIILAGATTNMPKIQADLANYFPTKKLSKLNINAEQAIVIGAALEGEMLSLRNFPDLEGLSIVDTTSLTIGLASPGGQMVPIIQRNSIIPVKKKIVFTTTEDNQKSVFLQVYEGEKPKASDNHLLAKFSLTDLKPLKAGLSQIVVTFQVDTNGVLHVTAVEKETGHRKSVSIINDQKTLTIEEVNKILQETNKANM